MKEISVGNRYSVPLPDGFQWRYDPDTLCLEYFDQHGILQAEFVLMDYRIPDFPDDSQRSEWCHDWLVDYLRDAMGPPYQSHLAPIDGTNWVGWQSVTAMGKRTFKVTRCIAHRSSPLALRISFSPSRESGVETLILIVENVRFRGEKGNDPTDRQGAEE